MTLPAAQNVIESYVPEAKQREFHSSLATYRAFIGGFGSGKTKTLIWEGISLSMAYPGNRGAILRDTMVDLQDSTMSDFFDECPDKLIATYRKTEQKVVLVNGSEIIFRAFRRYKRDRRNQNEGKIKALNLGWWGIDEMNEIEESEFKLLQARLRLSTVPRHCGFGCTNPPNKEHWIAKTFDGAETDPNQYFAVHASTRDNIKHLPPDYIPNLEASYKDNPAWVQKFIDGEYGFIVNGTPAYAGFNEDWHCPKTFPGHSTQSPVHRYWDFGWRRPAVVWAQKDSEDRWRIYKELLGHNISLQQFAPRVITTSNERFPGCAFIDYGDPAGAQHSDKEDRSSFEILKQDFGVRIISRPSLIGDGYELIQRMLLTMKRQEPQVQINKEECPNIVNGFVGGFARDAEGALIKDGYYDHLHDCLRYGAINVFAANSAERYAGNFPIGGPKYGMGNARPAGLPGPQVHIPASSPWRLLDRR